MFSCSLFTKVPFLLSYLFRVGLRVLSAWNKQLICFTSCLALYPWLTLAMPVRRCWTYTGDSWLFRLFIVTMVMQTLCQLLFFPRGLLVYEMLASGSKVSSSSPSWLYRVSIDNNPHKTVNLSLHTYEHSAYRQFLIKSYQRATDLKDSIWLEPWNEHLGINAKNLQMRFEIWLSS